MAEREPLRILYMEDDLGLAALFRRKMEREGYAVDHAADGSQGLDMLKEKEYDLLVVDHQMPVMTGLEAVKELALHGRLIPTIMITGAGNEQVAVEAMRLGATDYIIKDIEGLYLDLIPSVLQGTLAKHELMEDKRKADSELLKIKERLEAVLNATSDMACLLDPEGRFLTANSPLAEYVGYSHSNLLGKSFFELVPKEVARIARDVFNNAVETLGPVKTEKGIRDRFYEFNLQPVRESEHGVGGVALFLRDITEQKKAEDLVVRSARMDAVADVVGGVAHSFNNLLQIVIGEARMALAELEAGSYEAIETSLEQIIESSIRGADTVKLLQSFSATRSDSPASQGATFDLSETVRKAMDLARLWWNSSQASRNSQLEVDAQLASNCYVTGREDELLEVAMSLIKSSAQAPSASGGIHVRTFKETDHIIFQVSGPLSGIGDETLQRLFEPSHESSDFASTGKGLASSFGIITRHGGEISISGGNDEPRAIMVRLPASSQGAELSPDNDESEIPPMKILVIDDLQPVLNVVAGKLRKQDHHVIATLSGEEGLEYFENNSVDLVICDLMMPGMSGWEVAQRMQAINERRNNPKTPFLLLTGWTGQLDKNPKIEKYGIDGVLEKPIQFSELFDYMRRLTPRPSKT